MQADGINWKQLGERAGMGFLMGATAGMSVGILHGGYTALRYGPTPGKSYLGTVASYMVSSGGMLGVILGFGSMIRGESSRLEPLPLPHSFYSDVDE